MSIEEALGFKIDSNLGLSQNLNMELPTAAEVSRDLFAEEADTLTEKYKDSVGKSDDCSSFHSNNFTSENLNAEKKLEHLVDKFDVNEFLMRNNFEYTPLDSLIRDMDTLSGVIDSTLVEEVSENYGPYLEFCNTYSADDNEVLLELQRAKSDISNFKENLDKVTNKELARSKEVITDTLEYLHRLDEMGQLLENHTKLAESLSIATKLGKTLHLLCGIDELNQTVCNSLILQSYKQVKRSNELLVSLADISSLRMRDLRNEYNDMIQTFQISLKLLTDRCLNEPKKYRSLADTLLKTLGQMKN
ncbi:hypothetical protein TBLA_0C05360 [Henningerozyma blattae CBS 6284]|uniref:Conserved oligomeric Golgi complex subunit 2 n=1 Tax=Henningerozyma blattae (strain ATCC 34711 / CBS 6284 / DSM 70876 / NBRC 10599 / NRRL Y-10934 / UCD 77-7) TaxID=1071380 RepID=I2H1T1_HENB6|nr:hypothetical protein TBLA_0C05360 [Tetrapisispora blattae CBS 6284]CCH60333.1 hypothetical protein TBLA_0C05360 [Tetrapisispora blattae CBS 6284]